MAETSEFDLRVYEAVKRIPRGRVTTYGVVARHIECGSARAVGQALKRNPFAPEIPCHRVIGADYRVGGFEGGCDSAHIRRKTELLHAEGVTFRNGRLLDRSRMLTQLQAQNP